MIDRTGIRYGFWTVLEFGKKVGHANYMWLCRCDCGVERLVGSGRLINGRSKSCGCESGKNTDYTGMIFGFWTVLKKSIEKQGAARLWLCRCACGFEKLLLIGSIKYGGSKSCGCGANGITNTRHGMTSREGKSLTYSSWSSMKSRCLNANTPVYKYYGGRGIQVCGGLQRSVINLIDVIGERPSSEMTIDRKKNNGHYSCGKCEECVQNGWEMNIRWATWYEQSRNRRSNVVIFIDGKHQIAGDAAKEKGIDPSGFYKRIKRERSMA